MNRILLILITIFLCIQTEAQSFLELRKVGKAKGYRFYVGENIRFRQKNYEEFTRGLIVDLPNDSTIRFYQGNLNINEIAEVDVRMKLRGWEWKLVFAGGAFVGLEALNSAIQGRTFKSNRGLWLPAGALVGSGLLANIVKPKKFKTGSRRRLYVVKVEMER